MSLDSCLDEDVGEAAKVLESMFNDIKKYMRNSVPEERFADAKDFVRNYNLCVRSGRSTDEFRVALPRYLNNFGCQDGCAKHAVIGAGLLVSGVIAYNASLPQSYSIAGLFALACGTVYFISDLFKGRKVIQARNDLKNDPIFLDNALKILKEKRIAEYRECKG